MKILNLLPITAALLVTGCATFDRTTHHRTSSVVEYLYPGDLRHVETTGIPVLKLPLRVGVAFVPASDSDDRRQFGRKAHADFTENERMELMQRVSTHFESREFVQSIELIPSAYLQPAGGFQNLDQLRGMFGIDVIVLLSYDQVQFTDENIRSVAYWTVVGMYFVPGELNDTRTMVDAVVYDIRSRTLLFRAPGVSGIKASATPINIDQKLRRDREMGLVAASTDMLANLDDQLRVFQERVKDSPDDFKIEAKAGYKGAMAFGGFEVFLVSVLGAVCLMRRIGR